MMKATLFALLISITPAAFADECKDQCKADYKECMKLVREYQEDGQQPLILRIACHIDRRDCIKECKDEL